MDFSFQAPQEKSKFLDRVGKVAVRALPVASQFVPALKPVAAVASVITAIKQ